MIISKKNLENLVKVCVADIQRKNDALSAKIGAYEKHIEFLQNHVERHANRRESAEQQVEKMYTVIIKAVENMVGQSSAKELIEAALSKRRE